MSSQHQGDPLLRVVLVVLAVIVLFPLLMMVLAMPMLGMMGWWLGGTAGPGVGMSPLWGIGVMLVFLVVVIGIGYVLYRGIVGSHLGRRDRAIEELRSTYARGDLNDEEYEQRLQRLTRDRD